MKVKYYIGQDEINLNLDGEIKSGEERVLLNEDDNLLEGTPWDKCGFVIAPFLTDSFFSQVKSGMKEKIAGLIERVGGAIDEKFELENYHKYVNDQQHYEIATLIQFGWNVDEFPIEFSVVEKRISEIIGKNVSAYAKHIDVEELRNGLSDKRYGRFYNFMVRIVRPQKTQDNNPPHRDVWIDRLRNAINIYAPICGSSENSALPLVPGSHYLKESEIQRTASGAILNGTKYSVPCVISIKGESPQMERPNPKENEVLVFSPYLVHGGGYNLDIDKTRISLEIRFWRV